MTYDTFSEIFFDIPGWEGYYQINLNEQVKSLSRYMNSLKGGRALLKERLMTVYVAQGYKAVILTKDCKGTVFQLHRLMAKTFIPNPEKKRVVRHLNDSRLDNRINNLMWGSYADNTKDAYENNRMVNKNGGDHGMARVVLDTQTGIFYETAKEAAILYGYTAKYMYRMLGGDRKNKTPLIYV